MYLTFTNRIGHFTAQPFKTHKPVVEDNDICHMLTCCKEHDAAVQKQGNLRGQRGERNVQILTCLFFDRPFFFRLYSDVVLIYRVMYRCWCWKCPLCTWFLPLYIISTTFNNPQTSPARLHMHLFLLPLFFQYVYMILIFTCQKQW